MSKTRLIFLAIGFLLMLVASHVIAAPVQQATGLKNASFEDPYLGEGVADGWVRWHQESADPGNCSGPYAFMPNWSRETNGALVRNGSVSQHVGNQYDTWHGGVWQTVNATAGSRYRFSFWAIGRASNEQYPTPSDAVVNLGVRAGLDPNGSGVWTDADIVWGGSGSPHDTGDQSNWQQFSVEAAATGNQITVFVAADLRGANHCRAHLDVWFDQAELVEVGPPPTNTLPPQPTSPPVVATDTPVPPTTTDTPEATSTSTPEPVATATATNTGTPLGTICVNAFADNNKNGQHEGDEGAMAGVTFTIAKDGLVAGTGVSTGPAPVCFDELEPGAYQVAQTVPSQLEMTTGASTEVTVGEGQTLEIKFGSRQRPADEGNDDEVPASSAGSASGTAVTVDEQNAGDGSASGSSFVAASGLVVLFIAIVLLGGLIYFFLRERA